MKFLGTRNIRIIFNIIEQNRVNSLPVNQTNDRNK